MAKIMFLGVVVALAVVIFVVRRLLSGSKKVWAAAKVTADQIGEPESNFDPVFQERNQHLDQFLIIQRALFSGGEDKPRFKSERERLLYVNFVLGAVDQLSRTINDEEKSQMWFFSTALAQASLVCPVDDAIDSCRNYGQTGDPDLQEAGRRGWVAMQTYIMNCLGKVSSEDFKASCMQMYLTVRGVSPSGQ